MLVSRKTKTFYVVCRGSRGSATFNIPELSKTAAEEYRKWKCCEHLLLEQRQLRSSDEDRHTHKKLTVLSLYECILSLESGLLREGRKME